MVVDPPDGKIPLQPWAMDKRAEIMAHQDKVEYLDPRVRCLQSGLPRANLPVGYNTYQIVQIPGYVVLLYEWNHMTRLIPLDGRPHISPKIKMPMGDSRGRWEGNTLVVDVTNFDDRSWVVGHGAPPEGAPASSLTTGHGVFHSEALHVVERFTLIDAETIRYEATIEDPNVFTRPWKIDFNAFTRAPADHQLFEYACHEGNSRNIKMMTGFDIEKGKAGVAMTTRRLVSIVGLVLFHGAAAVSAHHAFSSEFDAARPVNLKGTVSKTEWVNPHSWIHIDVKDAQRQSGRPGRSNAARRTR